MKHVNYSMKATHILCHYSEIGLKGKNRSYFENTLKRNIHDALNVTVPNAIDTIEKLRGRFLISLSESNTNSIDSILSTLENRFGLAYFAPAIKIHPDLDSMKLSALEILKDITFDTFRITARRSDPYLPYSSQKINEEIGAEIVSKLNKIVNLSNPEVTCYIDMLQEGTFVYTQKISGPGGLPVGVSGKVGVMLSGGIDSPVAAYYAMKRGASPLYIHFHSVPHVSPASIEKVRETVRLLKKYHLRSKLYIIEFAPVQDEIFANANPKLLVLHYRRCMIRISENIMKKEKAKALVTGEALGQVASQTIENMTVVEDAGQHLILRPLVGFDKQEIIEVAKKIGTYDISIQPHEDCCTLFVPKHPAIKARIKDVLESENNCNLEPLIEKAVNTAQVETFQ